MTKENIKSAGEQLVTVEILPNIGSEKTTFSILRVLSALAGKPITLKGIPHQLPYSQAKKLVEQGKAVWQ